MALTPYLQIPDVEGDKLTFPDVKQQAAEMLAGQGAQPKPGAPGAPPVKDSNDFFKRIGGAPAPAPQEKEGLLTGTGRAIAGGAAELGHQITGAAAWAGNEFAPGSTVSKGLNWANQVAGQSAQDWQQTLTPQDRELMAREWTTLDPAKSIWTGSPHDFVHTLTLQMANAAPATLAMLLPMTAWAKAGMTAKALTYVGATQAGLSLGQLSNNIQQEIASRDDNTLRQQSPQFAQMLDKGMDPAQARQQLTADAQRYAPVVGGLMAGAISTIAGRFLTPVLTGQAGMGILKRAGAGFLDQAAQGAGIGASNYLAGETAAQTYDKGRAPDLAGGLHAAGEAAAAQGALGAGLAVTHGRSGPLHTDKAPNQPEAANLHQTMANTPENKATGAATENHVTNMHADETPDTSQWEGEGGNTGQPPPPPGGPRGQIPLDLQGALEAHYNPQALRGEADYREQPPYRGAPPNETPPGPGPGGDPAAQAAIQEQLPLRGGMNPSERPGPTPPVPAPAQLNLPLRRQARGGPEFPPVAEPPRPQTVADQLRARQASPTQDWNQPDLLRDQPVPGQLTTRGNRPTIQGNAEAPGALPHVDVERQLQEMQDPNHPRAGVWLSGDTVASLRRSGLLERVRDQAGNEAVPLVNFDGKGGALIARDQATADELTHYRANKVGTPEEIIEHATGEKQGAAAPAEILRRAALTNIENDVQQRARAEKETANVVRRSAEQVPNETVADRLRAAAARDLATGKTSPAISSEEAAKRMTSEAQRIHSETTRRAWRGIGAPDPRDVDFHSEELQRQYENLDHELAGMRVMRNTARTPEEVEHAKAGLAMAEDRIVRFLGQHEHETLARAAGRAAVRVSPEGVREFAEARRQAGRQRVEPLERLKTEHLAPEPRATRAELRSMHPDELKSLYNEAIEKTAAPKLTPEEEERRAETAKLGGKIRQTMTAEEMRAADRGLRSLMEKRIARFYRTEAEHEAIGTVRSDKMAVSPRRALTERETQLNAAKTKGQQRIVGYKTFDPRNLLADVESQKEMEANVKGRREFSAMRTKLKKQISLSVKSGEKAIAELSKVQESRASTPMARRYLQQILTYGRSLRDGPMRSAQSMSAAKQFIAHVEHLAKMEPAKRALYLHDTYETELKRQLARGAAANPERVSRIEQVGEPLQQQEAHGTGGEQMRLGMGEKFSAAARQYQGGAGHQMTLPFEQRVQPKFGYTAEKERTPELTAEETAELSRLVNKQGPKQYKLALRGGQAEPQGTTLEAENLSQGREADEQHRSALGYPQKPTAFRGAAQAVADHFENGPVNAHTVIQEVLRSFDQGSPMHRLFTALSHVVDKDSLVGWGTDLPGHILGQTRWAADAPNIHLNRDLLEASRARGVEPSFELMRTLGHEFAHIATRRAIEANPAVRARLEAILAEVQLHPEAKEWYGARKNDIHEMVAEAYGNERFQRWLDNIRMPNTGRTLWTQFKRIVADILGFHGGNEHYSALDAIMREHGQIFKGKMYDTTKGMQHLPQHLETDREGGHVGNAIDRIEKSAGFVKRLYSNATEGAGQAGLSAMTPRQQSAQFSKYFERADGSNPYRRYWDTFFARAADNALSMERVGKISNHWSNIEERHGIDQAATLSRIMHDSTIYGFHPDLAAGAPENEHVRGDNVGRAAAARQEFEALHPEMQAHYRTMKQYYAEEQRHTTDQIVLNALHAMLTKGEDAAMTAKEFDSKYDAETVRKLGLDTQEGLQKEFGDKLSGASQDMLAKIGKLSQSKGPYFPLMRNGDYVVNAKRQIASKEFDTSQEAQAYMREQRGNDPTLAVSVRHDVEDGVYRVNVVEKEFRMAETKSEAAQHRKEMAARYGEENTSPVQLKADLYKGEASITTGSALDSILRRLEGNPAAQTAIKDFYLRSLGEQSFRKRELTRQNVRGVDIQNQHRSFAQYGRSQSYYLSQLKYGRHLANAQGEVHDAVQAHHDESQVSAVRMGEFAHELALRDQISRSPYEVSDLVRKGSSLTQFYMLTSPSHWFVRAAQPYMLTAPWLGARHGYGESMAALTKAQGMIANPLLSESVESGLGLKALFSRAAAEKTYSVIDQVMAHLTKNGADPKINEMIQHLRNNNLIDLSMATELADISKGKSTGLAARVLDAGRAMLHIAEVNNRVMTAIAARELGLKQGMSEKQAWDHAADAINVTHNDYSYGNTPRLFMAQAKGIFGGYRPLAFQFMKYPQQVYGMMISSGLAALKGKTALERQTGLRTLMGVLATHLVAAGAIGASIQPIKWAMGGLMAGASAMGLTDQPYTVANALSGDTYDHMLRGVMNDLFGTELGEVASKGLPAALGVDLSQRMALGSTYQFHLKSDSDASTLGSLLETFGGPWLNVAENFYDAGRSALAGQVVKSVQLMTPHIIRDLVKSGNMASNGVVNNAGQTLIPADKLSGPELFAQALGFRPEAISEVQDRNTAEKNALQNITDQRKALLREYASADPSERNEVRQRIIAFGQQHPAFKIDYSTAQKAIAAKQLADREMQQYGVRLKGRQLPEIAREGAPYNVQ